MLDQNKLPYTLIPKEDHFLLYSKPSRAILYGGDWKLDLLTLEKSSFDCSRLLEALALDDSKGGRIVHLSYEAGYLFNRGEKFLGVEDWLAIDLVYEEISKKENIKINKKNIKLRNTITPTVEEYNAAFEKGYEHLEKGNCYQFNLTFPFLYKFEGDFADLYQNLFKDKAKLGEYAHATYMPSLNWGILSNSPECLFNQRDSFVETRPIKGTITDKEGALEELMSSEKERAELLMITDLLRNDLNKIEPVAKVIKLRAPLRVPGLIHQYSHITLETKKKVSLTKLTHSLFPGGSVTGVPKIRVLEILRHLEVLPRGAYCGSTLVFDKTGVRASVNIRTAEVDTEAGQIKYCAGGGITLLSNKGDEYNEMLLKVDSFTLLLQS